MKIEKIQVAEAERLCNEIDSSAAENRAVVLHRTQGVIQKGESSAEADDTLNCVAKFPTHYSSPTRERLFLEARAVRERIGESPRLKSEGKSYIWLCEVSQSGQTLPIKVSYPAGYPNTYPRIEVCGSLPQHPPHMRSATEICWTDGRDWAPATDTVATAMLAAQRWFACYLIWLTLGDWPTGASH